ncbi:MAG: hypothetical protein FWG91_06255 [Lachnospiraceae bacterium]|nr:hypothetical protein [Lachnospiraceae bacterium]
MNKKITVLLIVTSGILLTFGVAWDILSAIGFITLGLRTAPFFIAALLCGVVGAYRAGGRAGGSK